jgi:hypothetical protein
MPGERTPVTHWTRSWMGPRAGLYIKARGKILLPLPGIEHRSPGRPVVQSVARHRTDWATPAPEAWKVTDSNLHPTWRLAKFFLHTNVGTAP